VLATERYNKSEAVNISAGFEICIKDLVSLPVELMHLIRMYQQNKLNKPDIPDK
jgi:hypothetical protein